MPCSKVLRPEVLIIGGGATGAGIARDLALRGYDVLLAEGGDFSTGASGANHGMLHSGARYAVRDPSSARECAAEGRILKRTASFCIEDCGGLFVSLPGDDEKYISKFLTSCASAGVKAGEIGVKEALAMEPNLSPDIIAAVEVPDASVDPFFLVWGNIGSARAAGSAVLNHTSVRSFEVRNGRIVAAVIGDGADRRTVRPEMVINAGGAWAGQIASMAGLQMAMQLDKGSMIVFNGRLINRLVNRLRPPSDGDILVPHRSSTILGTTSGPGVLSDVRSTERDVERLLDEARAVLPGIHGARMIRAYAGVRPLLVGGAAGREATRGFQVIDHAPEVDNLISVVGGKLTTYRLMAEKAADLVAVRLGPKGHCRTRVEELVPPGGDAKGDFHAAIMNGKYGARTEGVFASVSARGGDEACSCESVSYTELEHYAASGDVRSPGDLMRRTRAGMGFCQAGLCAFEMASVLDGDPVRQAEMFLQERWKGVEPVLRGDQLRQEAFKAHLFRVYGIDHTAGGT
jgi:glycerol-3-phosphate dehydrogenase